MTSQITNAAGVAQSTCDMLSKLSTSVICLPICMLRLQKGALCPWVRIVLTRAKRARNQGE